jgi:GntR family transcriptional repressor for pyruvate dehydrogenase complex
LTARAHEALLGYVEGELAAGRLHISGRLPGERALAEQLNISRASVREGMRVLEAMGVIRTSAGSGPEAGAIVVADASVGMTSALRLHLASSSLPVADMVSTRVLLESWSVREAARRRDRPQLASAAALLDSMDERDLPIEKFLRLDAEFHVALARATGNTVVAAVMTSLRVAIHEYILAGAPSVADWPAMSRRLRRQHRNVLAAVSAGDADRAARLVIRHIEGFDRATRRSVG